MPVASLVCRCGWWAWAIRRSHLAVFDCDVRVSLPRIDDPGYITALHQRCLDYGVSVLIPGLDAELLPLARHREQFSADGIEVLVSAEPLVALCWDKARMAPEMARQTGAFIKTWTVTEACDPAHQKAFSWPLIAKPRHGCASRGVVVIRDAASLERLGSDVIIQPIVAPQQDDVHRQAFLDGLERGQMLQLSEISAQVVIGREGRELGRMATCNNLVHGVPTEIIPVDVPALWAEIDQFLPQLLELGLRGPLNIQGRITDEGPRFFEMNARFTGITGLRALMGFNEVEAAILDALDGAAQGTTLSHNPCRIGLRQTADRVVDIGQDQGLAETVPSRLNHRSNAAGRHVLVTGANGYLGRATLSALLQTAGVGQITALVRDPGRFNAGEERPLPKGVIVRDIADLWNGTLSMGLIDVLIHLAAGRPKHGPQTIAESLQLTRDLMTLATKHQLPGIINASSQSVYGLSRPPLWSETLAPSPETAYAQAKWSSELMAMMPGQFNQVTKATSIRFAQFIGLGAAMRWDELPHLFMRRAAVGETITLQGGQQQLDYLHVRDAARLIAQLCVHHYNSWPDVLNAGSGCSISLADFSRLVTKVSREVLNRVPVINVVPASVNMTRGMTIKRARQCLQWKPEISMEMALREIARHLLEQEASGLIAARPAARA